MIEDVESGTSPRTRGKLFILIRCMTAPRNIPAHAGKTLTTRVTTLEEREHPRARGENVITMADRMDQYGTSPRTRGKRYGQPNGEEKVWNIPAHAGKTFSPILWACSMTEHPRARGEN